MTAIVQHRPRFDQRWAAIALAERSGQAEDAANASALGQRAAHLPWVRGATDQDLISFCQMVRHWAWSRDMRNPVAIRRIGMLWAWLGIYPDKDPRYAALLGRVDFVAQQREASQEQWLVFVRALHARYVASAPDPQDWIRRVAELLSLSRTTDETPLLAELVRLRHWDCEITTLFDAAQAARMPGAQTRCHRLITVLYGPFWHQNPLHRGLNNNLTHEHVHPALLKQHLRRQRSERPFGVVSH